MVTWFARTGVGQMSALADIIQAALLLKYVVLTRLSWLAALCGTSDRRLLVMWCDHERGNVSANLASDRKFCQNFGAVRAPANFESNFGKSLVRLSSRRHPWSHL